MKNLTMAKKVLAALLTMSLVVPNVAFAYEKRDSSRLSQRFEAQSLDGWKEDSEGLEEIMSYVEAAVDPDAASYVPKEDRIAVFDMDGTIYAEDFPSAFETCFLLNRILNDDTYEPEPEVEEFAIKALHAVNNDEVTKEMQQQYFKLQPEPFKGLTLEEYNELVYDYLESPADGYRGMKKGEAFFLPMLSLIDYLRENEFDVYICTGSDRTMARALLGNALDIAPDHVIGSDNGLTIPGMEEGAGDKYDFTSSDELVLSGKRLFTNLKTNKVLSIVREIGKCPVLAFGNSSGDYSMAEYVCSNMEYDGEAFFVIADDEKKTHAKRAAAGKVLAECEDFGFNTISMKDDFDTVFGSDVEVVSTTSVSNGNVHMNPDAEGEYYYGYEHLGQVDVNGRQGIACGGDYFIVSDTGSLMRYDKDWNLERENVSPFAAGFEDEVNHIGDIDVYEDEIFAPVEYFDEEGAKNLQVAVYNAKTLELDRLMYLDSSSGQDEVSGIAVNPDDETFWLSCWSDGESGKYLYQYDLESAEYLGKIKMRMVPEHIQGIAYADRTFYVTADDGNEKDGECDHIYSTIIKSGDTTAVMTEELDLEDVQNYGEIEGISFDPETGNLYVLHNSGAEIVNGFVQGLYNGYDKELHEVYIFSPEGLGSVSVDEDDEWDSIEDYYEDDLAEDDEPLDDYLKEEKEDFGWTYEDEETVSSDQADFHQVEKSVETTSENRPGSQWFPSTIQGAVSKNQYTNPKDDYYTWANKDYISGLRISDGKVSAGIYADTDKMMEERSLSLLKDKSIESHDAKLVQQFFETVIDWEKRDEIGLEQVQGTVDRILSINSIEEATDFQINDEDYLVPGFFGVNVQSSFEDSSKNMVNISPSMLLLGDSEEYQEITEAGQADKKMNEEQIRYMLGRLGLSSNEAQKAIENCETFETKLAESMLTEEELGHSDVFEKVDNSMTFKDMEDIEGNFPLTRVLRTKGYAGSREYNVEQPDWLEKLGEIYTDENIEEIKDYLLCHYVLAMIRISDKAAFDKLMECANERNGSTGALSTDAYGVAAVNKYLPLPLDYVYIDRYCSKEEKNVVLDLVQNVIERYKEMLGQEDWLSSETREKAIEKLDSISVNACYGEKRYDYSELIFPENASLVDLIQLIAVYNEKMDRAKINRPVDRDIWDDSTRENNAFYDFMKNSITILHGGMGGGFDKDAEYEEIMGSVGYTIGHEISHAFDSSGAQFDKDGNFNNWWTDKDYEAFEARTKKLSDYMSEIVPFEGAENIKGEVVEGEMTADLGGVKVLMQIASEKEGFDYDLFFKTLAHEEANVFSEGYLRHTLQYDEHPLGNVRINVVLQNTQEFYDTYDVKEGDGMYLAPENRINIW